MRFLKAWSQLTTDDGHTDKVDFTSASQMLMVMSPECEAMNRPQDDRAIRSTVL